MKILKENKYTIPIFIPHKGCNNECVFCNQKKISGQVGQVTIEDVKNKIEEYLGYYTDQEKDKKVEIAFFGGSFTGLEVDNQRKYLEIANKYIRNGKVQTIRISTRPDYINREILEMLKEYNVETVELGVQSMDDGVLIASKRGHNSKDVVDASRLIKDYGFKLGHQVMIGLPESTLEKEIYTSKKSIELGPDVVRIYPVYVLRETKLWEMLEDKDYTQVSLEDSVERTKRVYSEYIKKNINVIRVGLQVTDEINEKNANIKGPVCDNYKERILSSIMKDVIERKFQKRKSKLIYRLMERIYNSNSVITKVPVAQINYAKGNNKCNMDYFENKYNVKFKVVKI